MSQSKRVVIIGAGPGGLASAMLLAGRATGDGAGASARGRRPDLDVWSEAGFGSTSGRRSSSIRASSNRSSRPLAATCTTKSSWSGSTRSITWSSARRRAEGDARPSADGTGDRRSFSPGDAGSASAGSSPTTGSRWIEFRTILESPFLRLRDLLSPSVAEDAAAAPPLAARSTASCAATFDDPRIRLAMTFQSKYLGMSPFNCPSLFSILSFLEYEYGVLSPDRRLRRGLAGRWPEVAEELGVEISLDDEVEEILFEGRRAVGVRSRSGVHAGRRPGDQRRLRPRHDPARPRPPAPPLDRRARSPRSDSRARRSCSTWASRAATTTWPHHTIYLAKDYRDNLDDIETRHVLSERSVVLRPERLRDRPVPGPAGHEHALRPGAGDAPAPQRRLGPGKMRGSAIWRYASLRRSGSTTSSHGSASSR